ncbi:hypothetical protein KTC96_22615 (plasmid) [Clostridium estertheticum]|uniref:hypothetical protein n=1 Tax=Clostridium estertheticum TaxID=238834 RepID=UPI001C7D7D9C|nr:hypothetical protein [Clostridium estertheticum]MBX4260409.1 hypothetical protein [Clostridium estertheticum]WLC73009.1 hypothetical protein KTC96_22615 [Clostridium estertheticum]
MDKKILGLDDFHYAPNEAQKSISSHLKDANALPSSGAKRKVLLLIILKLLKHFLL